MRPFQSTVCSVPLRCHQLCKSGLALGQSSNFHHPRQQAWLEACIVLTRAKMRCCMRVSGRIVARVFWVLSYNSQKPKVESFSFRDGNKVDSCFRLARIFASIGEDLPGDLAAAISAFAIPHVKDFFGFELQVGGVVIPDELV